MKHPTKEAVLKVANAFRELSKNEEYKVQSNYAHIVKGKCNTIACHAGWYLYHKHKNNGYWAYTYGDIGIDYFTPLDENKPKKERTSLAYVFNYGEGATLMAKDLGFDYAIDLKIWARENPEIWGNSCGEMMFSAKGEDAFNKNSMQEVTLLDIANHWENVAERLPLEVSDV